MMRQLDQDEKEFIGQFALLVLIVGIPFSIFIESTQPVLDTWGKNIIASGITADHPQVVHMAILFVIIDYGKVFVIFPIMHFGFKLLTKLGFDSRMPMRWRPYMYAGFKKKKIRIKNEQSGIDIEHYVNCKLMLKDCYQCLHIYADLKTKEKEGVQQ